MIVDANLLIYARHEGSTHPEEARAWLPEALDGNVRVGLPWQSLTAFTRIATNGFLFERPLSARDAADQVEEWCRAKSAWVPGPGPGYREAFRRLLTW